VAKFKILEGLNMDVIEAIQERRSTRGFLDKPVGKETLERLLHLATQAPSAINLQPWEFAVVSGEERKRLSRVLVKRMRERAISCGPGAKNPLPEYLVDQVFSSARLTDIGIVVGYFVLAAHAPCIRVGHLPHRINHRL
jgi:nitroreductase